MLLACKKGGHSTDDVRGVDVRSSSDRRQRGGDLPEENQVGRGRSALALARYLKSAFACVRACVCVCAMCCAVVTATVVVVGDGCGVALTHTHTHTHMAMFMNLQRPAAAATSLQHQQHHHQQQNEEAGNAFELRP